MEDARARVSGIALELGGEQNVAPRRSSAAAPRRTAGAMGSLPLIFCSRRIYVDDELTGATKAAREAARRAGGFVQPDDRLISRAR